MDEELERYLHEIINDNYTVGLFLKDKERCIPVALKTPLDKRTVKMGMCYNSKECIEYVKDVENPNVSSLDDVSTFIATRCCPNCFYYHNTQFVAFHLFQ